MNRIAIFLLFPFFFSLTVKSQIVKYSNEFLSLGVGARALGMGNAVVAGTGDADGVYWNPASLQQIKDKVQVSLMHNEQFAGIVKHDYVAVTYRQDQTHAFGLAMIRAGVDDIPNTLNLFQNGQMDYSRIRTFSAVDYAFIGSYARISPIENLSVGGNVKVIRRILGDFAGAWGFGFDLGAQYHANRWILGVALRDVTSTFNVWNFEFSEAEKQVLLHTNNSLPSNSLEITAPKAVMGIAGNWELLNQKLQVRPELNMDVTVDGVRNVLFDNRYISIDPRVGLELGYKKLIFIRSGLMNFQRQTAMDGTISWTMMPTLGAGIRIHRLMLDYALANPAAGGGSSLPYSNIISVKLGIGGNL